MAVLTYPEKIEILESIIAEGCDLDGYNCCIARESASCFYCNPVETAKQELARMRRVYDEILVLAKKLDGQQITPEELAQEVALWKR